MPQQLIYTSAPRGVIAGRSGYCTVARSAAMRDALMLQLEKLSYYQHLSLSGGQERPIFCCRVLDIRGSRYHVLTRIQDAGLDFTGRTNFLAHHLVFSPEEIRQFASPPIILRAWSGWINSWTKEPELFGDENWSSLAALPAASAPAANWQQLTGDAANGYGLLEARAGIALHVDNLTDDQVLALFAESLELLELRDPRRDFRASRWQYTFTTSMQEQDNPADFRWRCLHSDNPAANRFAGPDTRALTDIRVARATNEESLFARAGRQPPRFVVPPQNISSAAGETARLHAKAEGVPSPAYQWLAVDRAGNRQPIPNATSEELLLPNPPLGITRFAVRATNSEGEITSDVVVLSVEPKGTGGARPPSQPPITNPSAGPPVKSAEEIERQRQRLEAERAQGKPPIRKWPFMMLGIALLIFIGAAIALSLSGQKKAPPTTRVQRNENRPDMSNLQHPSNTVIKDMAKETPAEAPAETNPAAAFSSGTPEPSNSAGISFSGTINSLPSPWAPRRIGNIPAATWASAEKEDFIIHGSGRNIGDRADNFFFVQRPASNPMDFRARVKTADRQLASRHGIMMRESIKPDAAFAFIGVSQTSVFWAHRDIASSPCQFINFATTTLPIYLRLTRRTNNICSAYSMNGSDWTWLGTNQVTFSDPTYLIGMAVSSGNASSVQTVFDRVTVTNLLIE
jgi:regulation of enolase protein 1 (concanavalin A-like superfamily)